MEIWLSVYAVQAYLCQALFKWFLYKYALQNDLCNWSPEYSAK